MKNMAANFAFVSYLCICLCLSAFENEGSNKGEGGGKDEFSGDSMEEK